MKNLKTKLLFLLIYFCLFGCQSVKTFNIKGIEESDQKKSPIDLHAIYVNSNRVRQTCLFFDAEGDNKWRHQYYMYVLNDRNEVLEIMESTNQDKESCYNQMYKIEAMLRSESQIRICAHGELKKSNISGSEQIQFGSLGVHKIGYKFMNLDSVCNSKKCFGDNSEWTRTCPGFIKN